MTHTDYTKAEIAEKAKGLLTRHQLAPLVEKYREQTGFSVKAESWWAGGTAEFYQVVVYGRIRVRLTWPNGVKKRFEGEVWGLGAGAGVSAGGGPWGAAGANYLPPNGEMGFQLTTAALHGGLCQIFWIAPPGVMGAFVGPAVGETAFEGGGKGVWSNDW